MLNGAPLYRPGPSVVKFRKLDGKVGITDKIYASSKNRNYIHSRRCYHFQITGQVTTAYSFNKVSGQKQKKDILFYFRMLTRSFGPESR